MTVSPIYVGKVPSIDPDRVYATRSRVCTVVQYAVLEAMSAVYGKT